MVQSRRDYITAVVALMGRIRTIKPEFPHSESIGALSRDARLLFIQIWTLVDDEGRARAASRMLASLLYPYDADAGELMPVWLGELEQTGLIRLYDVEHSRYLEITKWLKHQKIDHPSRSRLPGCPVDLANPREPSRTLAPDLGPRTRTKDQGSVDRSSDARSCDWPSDFRETFWRLYPRKVGKRGALSELERVRKRGIPWQGLIDAVAAYGAAADPQFTKHPKTWLSQGCWDDEPDTRKPNGKAPTIVDAQRQHIANRIEFGPRPKLIPSGAGAGPVRLLPEGGRERSGHLHGSDHSGAVGVFGGGDPACDGPEDGDRTKDKLAPDDR